MGVKMRKVKYAIICFLSSLILVMIAYIAAIYIYHPVSLKLWKPCVPDEEAAIGFAQIACRTCLGVDVEKDAFVAVRGRHEFGDEWQVYIKTKYDFDKELYKDYIITNDSGVFINSQDGTIMRFMINRDAIEEYYALKELDSIDGGQ